jgi:hypothetical protein
MLAHDKVTDLIERYPEAFHAEELGVTDTAAIRGLSNARLFSSVASM